MQLGICCCIRDFLSQKTALNWEEYLLFKEWLVALDIGWFYRLFHIHFAPNLQNKKNLANFYTNYFVSILYSLNDYHSQNETNFNRRMYLCSLHNDSAILYSLLYDNAIGFEAFKENYDLIFTEWDSLRDFVESA